MSFSSDKSLQSNQVPLSFDLGDPSSPDFKNSLSLMLKRMIDSLNSKEGALYFLQEQATFQKYFKEGDPQSTRNVYRTVVDCGDLPNTTTKSVPHGISGIDDQFTATHIYGAATKPTAPIFWLPLPYPSVTLANTIEVYVDDTNVNIVTAANYSAYTRSIIVIEYMKNL